MPTYFREEMDYAIRRLWLKFRDASDFHLDELTQEDLDLWDLVTRHNAVQGPIRDQIAKEKKQ